MELRFGIRNDIRLSLAGCGKMIDAKCNGAICCFRAVPTRAQLMIALNGQFGAPSGPDSISFEQGLISV